MSTAHDPLKPDRDAVFLKLGRTVALFQQLEYRLKALFVELVLEGSSDEDLAARRAKRESTVESVSLGLVAKALFGALDDRTCVAPDQSPPAGSTLFVHMRLNLEPEYREARRNALASLIPARNELIHHLGQRYDLRSAAGLRSLDSELEGLTERVRAEIREVDSLLQSVDESRKSLAAFFASDAFLELHKQQFLLHSPLVQGLIQMGADLARPDGWCVLQRALARLLAAQPDAAAQLRERYGYRTVKALLLATGAFELREEPTTRGSRLLFRPRIDIPLP